MVTKKVSKRKAGKKTGEEFLRQSLMAEQRVLAVQLELSAKSITHAGVIGDVNEQHFIDFLQRHLPRRYVADSAIIIDSAGNTSDQIDIVIFDQQYTPTLLDQRSHRYVPAEAVYAVLEAKPTITAQYLQYAGEKAASVRRLNRTSVAVQHVAGTAPPKPPFPIIAGIVAARCEWRQGLESPALAGALAKLTRNQTLDCGVALADRAFDMFDGRLKLSTVDACLASFLFRLLQKLQSLGTVPAIDWQRYGAAVSGSKVHPHRTGKSAVNRRKSPRPA